MEVWEIVKRIAGGVARRRKAIAALTFGLALLAFGGLAYYLSNEPPRFRSQATILIEARPDRVPIFQDLSPFRPLSVQLAILNSRSLAEGVLESLPKVSVQDLVENPYYSDYWLQLTNTYRRFMGREPEIESPQRRALKELQNARVKFDVQGASGIVNLSASASKPQIAQDIVNTYTEVLLARTRTFNVDDARVSREFLEQQVADIRKSMQSSDEALRAFTTKHGGVKVPEQAQQTVSRLSQAESALAEVTANRKMIEARLQGLQEKMENQKRNAPPQSAAQAPQGPSTPRPLAPSVQRLRDQLTRLEAALIELRTRYTEEHPRVALVRDQIAEIQQELGGAVKETTSVTPAASAVPPAERFNFGEQVVLLETTLHSTSAQEEALRRQVVGLRQSLSGLSQSETEYSRLTRESDSNRNLYGMVSDKLTAARIREQGEMKVVKVIDPPSYAIATTNEKRMKFGGIALLMALALGAGVPALLEWVKRPVEDEGDIHGVTGLPVLAIVPRVAGRRPLFLTPRERRDLDSNGRLGDAFLFTEAFHNLRVAIQLTGRVGEFRSLMITSAFSNEGKSTTLVNLGVEFGEAGRRVILADTDFLRPTLHETLNVEQNGGLVDVLHARRHVTETLAPVADRVRVATRGSSLQRDTRGVLATSRLKEMLGEMTAQAELVLCDSSPVLLVSDNLFLASAVDAVILVVKAGSTPCSDVLRAKTMLEGAGARILGVVINQMPVARLRRYYKRYYRASAREDVVKGGVS
jgi:polysaccharide biosynthesis transport protein